MMKSNVLVVLGNGYDIAWNYPTKYNDFFQNSNDLKKCANNGNQLCKYIINNYKTDLFWSDLEEGLYRYSRMLTTNFGEGKTVQATLLQKEFEELRKTLFTYIASVFGGPKEVSLQAPVMGLSVEWREVSPQYLTFNYSTTTLISAMGNDRSFLGKKDKINEDKFIYQHGSIYDTSSCKNNRPCQIVLGIDEETQKVEDLHSFLYKTHQNVYDLNKYKSIIDEKQLYIIYGCSIGDSDALYFKKIFNQKDKKYLIYYYDENALADIKGKINKITSCYTDFEANNQVTFLCVRDVINTRERTKEILKEFKPDTIEIE